MRIGNCEQSGFYGNMFKYSLLKGNQKIYGIHLADKREEHRTQKIPPYEIHTGHSPTHDSHSVGEDHFLTSLSLGSFT